MNKTLLTATEVTKNTPLEQTFPVAAINSVLPLKEWVEFDNWLGRDFYKILLADLVDHSSAAQWVDGGSYDDADKVLYEDYVFVSNQDSNTDAPINSSKWDQADKFTTSEYNDLWLNGRLLNYLALVIAKHANTFATYPTDSSGTKEQFFEGSGNRSATKGVFGMVQSALNDMIADAHRSVKCFIDEARDDSTRRAYYDKVGYIQENRPLANNRQRGIRRIYYPSQKPD